MFIHSTVSVGDVRPRRSPMVPNTLYTDRRGSVRGITIIRIRSTEIIQNLMLYVSPRLKRARGNTYNIRGILRIQKKTSGDRGRVTYPSGTLNRGQVQTTERNMVYEVVDVWRTSKRKTRYERGEGPYKKEVRRRRGWYGKYTIHPQTWKETGGGTRV